MKRPRTESPSKNSLENCVVCSKKATEDVFECGWCESRQHSECAKISQDHCNVLSKVVRNIVFFCTNCLEKVPAALQYYEDQVYVDSRLESVESKLSEVHQSTERKLSETIKTIESQLGDFRKEITATLVDNSLSAKQPDPSTPLNVSEDSVVQIAASVATEQKEKEKRQMNIILHNLEESNATDGTARKQDDIKKCLSVFQTYLGQSVSITNAFRLGQRAEKPRLLKVSLSSVKEKTYILKNKTKLRSTSNPPNIRNLFITPDLTPSEQKKYKALRQQLADMNKTGNAYMLKNGRIVRRNT